MLAEQLREVLADVRGVDAGEGGEVGEEGGEGDVARAVRSGSVVVARRAVGADLLLFLVDEAAAVAGVGEYGEGRVGVQPVDELPKVHICARKNKRLSEFRVVIQNAGSVWRRFYFYQLKLL